MTYPLGSLRTGAAPEPSAGGLRAGRHVRGPRGAGVRPVEVPPQPEAPWRQQARLLVGGVLLLAWVLAMVSHHPGDAAFTTSGTGLRSDAVNWMGHPGAWWSDVLQFVLGQSAWWLPAIGVRAWLGGLAGFLRRDTAVSALRRAQTPQPGR